MYGFHFPNKSIQQINSGTIFSSLSFAFLVLISIQFRTDRIENRVSHFKIHFIFLFFRSPIIYCFEKKLNYFHLNFDRITTMGETILWSRYESKRRQIIIVCFSNVHSWKSKVFGYDIDENSHELWLWCLALTTHDIFSDGMCLAVLHTHASPQIDLHKLPSESRWEWNTAFISFRALKIRNNGGFGAAGGRRNYLSDDQTNN